MAGRYRSIDLVTLGAFFKRTYFKPRRNSEFIGDRYGHGGNVEAMFHHQLLTHWSRVDESRDFSMIILHDHDQ